MDKNNLSRWVKEGKLVRLRNGFYSFPEYLNESGSQMYIANRIYRPSYISLQTALSFYGIIPEAVTNVTSVTTLKTAEFENRFGTFSYKTIQPRLFSATLRSLF
jgi:predicted transcriptional regulator of viral defense system